MTTAPTFDQAVDAAKALCRLYKLHNKPVIFDMQNFYEVMTGVSAQPELPPEWKNMFDKLNDIEDTNLTDAEIEEIVKQATPSFPEEKIPEAQKRFIDSLKQPVKVMHEFLEQVEDALTMNAVVEEFNVNLILSEVGDGEWLVLDLNALDSVRVQF